MRNRRGFTLIELLIVIVIIGIISTAALFAFGDFGSSRKIIVSAEQFSAYIKLLQQRAILGINTLGVVVKKNSYTTLQFTNSSWQSLPNSLFREHYFPKNSLVTLQKQNKATNKAPDIIIYSLGDMTPFQLNFGTENEPSIITLTGKQNGLLILEQTNDNKK